MSRLRTQNRQPPLPPVELRELAGPLEDHFYDNPTGELVFPEVPSERYDFVFDFGCGCGRIARQLIQQTEVPRRYVGVDLHLGAIQWCRRNLSRCAKSFEFRHQGIYNAGLNPRGKAERLPFPVKDGAITLFIGWSVFTHTNEAATSHYLDELSRVLRSDGTAITTWFLFDKADFPMMQEFQNALFINEIDPTNAVIFDRGWLKRTASSAGLVLSSIVPPEVRGFQWKITFAKARPGDLHADFPDDNAPEGIQRPPLIPENAERVGLDDATAESGTVSNRPGDSNELATDP